MKRLIIAVVGALLAGFAAGEANATLIVIGEATYGGTEYSLIYDAESPFGPITWLDYTRGTDTWQNQMDWASDLGTSLTIDLLPGCKTKGNWATDWRLPRTVDGPSAWGYDGTTTEGFNIITSEMGHLYYTELENKGIYDVNGNQQSGYGLVNTGPFTNLVPLLYWSGTEYSVNTLSAWGSIWVDGNQFASSKANTLYGLAVHPGYVHIPASIPEPSTLALLGLGMLGLLGCRLRRRK